MQPPSMPVNPLFIDVKSIRTLEHYQNGNAVNKVLGGITREYPTHRLRFIRLHCDAILIC